MFGVCKGVREAAKLEERRARARISKSPQRSAAAGGSGLNETLLNLECANEPRTRVVSSFAHDECCRPVTPQASFRKCDPLCHVFRIDSIIGNIALRELKVDDFARQALVNLRVCIKSVIYTAALLLVKHHLEHLAGILLGPCPLANNLNRVDEVVENGIVNSGQCS